MKVRRPPDTSSGSLFGDDGGGNGSEGAPVEGERPRYVPDPSDGLLAEVIKAHTFQKYHALRYYIDECSGVRQRWSDNNWGGSTFVDLYSGPGRALEGASNFVDGSPLLIWRTSCIVKGARDSRFSRVILGDANDELLNASYARLTTLGAPVETYRGTAEQTAPLIAKNLGRGYHFVLLDPHGLSQLPFSVIEAFAAIAHADMLIHFSVLGLNRNLGHNLVGEHDNFDAAVPGWRTVIDRQASDEANRNAIVGRWMKLVADLGKPVQGVEAVKRGGNVLYWLFLLSKSDLARRFWSEIGNRADQRRLTLP